MLVTHFLSSFRNMMASRKKVSVSVTELLRQSWPCGTHHKVTTGPTYFEALSYSPSPWDF